MDLLVLTLSPRPSESHLMDELGVMSTPAEILGFWDVLSGVAGGRQQRLSQGRAESRGVVGRGQWLGLGLTLNSKGHFLERCEMGNKCIRGLTREP